MQPTDGNGFTCRTTGSECKGCCDFCRTCERMDGAASGCWLGIAVGFVLALAGVWYLSVQ